MKLTGVRLPARYFDSSWARRKARPRRGWKLAGGLASAGFIFIVGGLVTYVIRSARLVSRVINPNISSSSENYSIERVSSE